MKQKKGFVLRQVCGEHVLMAEELSIIDFGKLVSLNPTAAFLWQEAERQGDFTVESLTDALCQEYAVDPDKAMTDVRFLMEQWQATGLTET